MICEGFDYYAGWITALLSMVAAIFFSRTNSKLHDQLRRKDEDVWQRDLYILKIHTKLNNKGINYEEL